MDSELEGFLESCRSGKKPLAADEELRLHDSIAVMFSNMCADKERRVNFSEIDKMGLPGGKKSITTREDPKVDLNRDATGSLRFRDEVRAWFR